MPNKFWIADFTYIPTEEGWLYLAGIKDHFPQGSNLIALLLRMNSSDLRSLYADSSHQSLLGKYEGIDIILEG